ncbi:TatD family hydrolase [Catenovulum sp. SM1970]|uniref:TatD family hydrolase n=1 Tax=Marinifaba aquimaris TaxID=2741323 RepID=UPI0015716E57|nr:TatD family hydrolase [Marinifaba aquimaris]NTS78334.1 TatD family hydrolase [Marinifaba aquimaris]
MHIDSHCHLDFNCFDEQREHVITNARKLNITDFVVPGTRFSTWNNVLKLSLQYPSIHIALGLHPYFVNEHTEEQAEQVSTYIATYQKAVAVGEIGLDYSLCESTWLKQKKLFDIQLSQAKKCKLPVILHHRKTLDTMAKHIRMANFLHGGVVHAFSGSYQQAKQYLDLGFKIGVGGTITYPRAQKTRKVIANLPLDCLVLETDSPDMPVMGKQGEINTPINLLKVFESLSEIRKEPAIEIEQACYQNTKQVFNLA